MNDVEAGIEMQTSGLGRRALGLLELIDLIENLASEVSEGKDIGCKRDIEE
jgi:hypothetical protein